MKKLVFTSIALLFLLLTGCTGERFSMDLNYSQRVGMVLVDSVIEDADVQILIKYLNDYQTKVDNVIGETISFTLDDEEKMNYDFSSEIDILSADKNCEESLSKLRDYKTVRLDSSAVDSVFIEFSNPQITRYPSNKILYSNPKIKSKQSVRNTVIYTR